MSLFLSVRSLLTVTNSISCGAVLFARIVFLILFLSVQFTLLGLGFDNN
jgi:hypothetical protein